MSYTSDQLTALRDAAARGLSEARLPDGSTVKWRSQAELLSMISMIENQLNVAPGRTNVSYPSHRRGFHD